MRSHTTPRAGRRAGALALALGAGPLLAGCAQEGVARLPELDPAGQWLREGSAMASMTLTPAGDGWDIVIHAGGDPADGAGIAADCELHAHGPLQDGRIDAVLVPFEGETMRLDAADIEAMPARLQVALEGDIARVQTDFAGCAAEPGGRYRRAR